MVRPGCSPTAFRPAPFKCPMRKESWFGTSRSLTASSSSPISVCSRSGFPVRASFVPSTFPTGRRSRMSWWTCTSRRRRVPRAPIPTAGRALRARLTRPEPLRSIAPELHAAPVPRVRPSARRNCSSSRTTGRTGRTCARRTINTTRIFTRAGRPASRSRTVRSSATASSINRARQRSLPVSPTSISTARSHAGARHATTSS